MNCASQTKFTKNNKFVLTSQKWWVGGWVYRAVQYQHPMIKGFNHNYLMNSYLILMFEGLSCVFVGARAATDKRKSWLCLPSVVEDGGM